jgi:hypothetical protein
MSSFMTLSTMTWFHHRPELNLQLRVSENLGEIQHVLGLSLITLSELQTDGAMIVIPEVFPESRNKHQPIDVFVAMPFREELREVFDDHIRRVCEDLSLSVFRADDLFSAQSVMADVWQAIRAAKVVVADCTDRNPNVFYEIGLAHVLGKHVVLLTQRADDVPFDVRHLRYITYTFTPRGMKKFEKILKRTLAKVLELE